MSYVWTFECSTCEEVGPELRRSAGGATVSPAAVTFLIDHQFHDVRLFGEGRDPSWVWEARCEQIRAAQAAYHSLIEQAEREARELWNSRNPELAAVPVEVATDKDIAAVTETLLATVGVTYAELEAQAAVGRFSSEEARLAWFAIKPLSR